MGAGCRVLVGAIGTNLKVWNADGIGTVHTRQRAGQTAILKGIFMLGVGSTDLAVWSRKSRLTWTGLGKLS